MKDGIYLSGEHNGEHFFGVTLIDSTNHLFVTIEAEPLLKKLFQTMKRKNDGHGDIGWYTAGNGKQVFGWNGEDRRVFDLNQLAGLEADLTARFYEDSYRLIETRVKGRFA